MVVIVCLLTAEEVHIWRPEGNRSEPVPRQRSRNILPRLRLVVHRAPLAPIRRPHRQPQALVERRALRDTARVGCSAAGARSELVSLANNRAAVCVDTVQPLSKLKRPDSSFLLHNSSF